MNRKTSGVRAFARRALAPTAVAGLAGLALSPQAAMAADAAADAPTEVSGVDVEAQLAKQPDSPKFTAPLVDTPRSVTIIPRQVIEQTAATSLQDILRNSPGITLGAGEGGQPLADRPFIRGQASGNNVFVDGVRDTGGQIREIFNIEQVEVIKGPDSAYNGRGSGGGSINLTSKRPQLDSFVHASAGAGTDSYLRGTVDANYRLGATSAVRLNLMATQGDTPGREVVDFDRWGAAVAVGAGIGTETRVTLSYYHLDADNMPDYGVPLFTKTPGAARTESGVLAVDRSSFYGLTARDYQTTRADIATLIAEHDVTEAITVRNVFRYSKTLNDYVLTNPGDGGAAQLIAGQWWMKRGTKSRWNPTRTVANVTDVYGEFTTGSLKHNFDVGLELARERNENASYIVYTTAGASCPAGFTNNVTSAGVGDCTLVYAPNPADPWSGVITRPPASVNTSKTVGFYAFDSIEFGERWLLNLGVRYDTFSVDGYDVSNTSSQGVVTGSTITPRSGDWDFVNYQVGLVYKPTVNSSVYISYGTASTPPTIAGGDQNTGSSTGSGNLANTLLDPEETTSLEAGVKWLLLNERLSASAAVFRTERKNAQIQIESGVYAQAGEARVQGLELGLSGAVTPAWQVFGGYTYMDSELVRGAYNNVRVGDPLANTPEHTFSLFTTYDVTQALSLGGGAYYVSDSFGGNQGGAGGGNNAVFAPAYWRFDLFASYQINEDVDLQLNVQNVADEEYILRTNGVHHADYGAGRQAILTLNVRF
ncbi:MAG: TonB-dependent receptor [Phenylobacterium sp.]|uniref:TonB-dependent receptor n=1 Tax=Phenylobacterium sp. TaxID=1871053 RepID=UPI00391B4379